MYGYVPDNSNAGMGDIILDEGEEFDQLMEQYPDHEVYLFAGNDIDMALFCAPGILAMLVEKRTFKDSV